MCPGDIIKREMRSASSGRQSEINHRYIKIWFDCVFRSDIPAFRLYLPIAGFDPSIRLIAVRMRVLRLRDGVVCPAADLVDVMEVARAAK